MPGSSLIDRVCSRLAAAFARATAPARGARIEPLEDRRLMSIVPWASDPRLPLTLVDASSGADLAVLRDGVTLDLAAIGSALNVRADPVGDAKSVAFAIDGQTFRTESSAPFTLAGDSRGTYNAWAPSAGDHTLTAIAYTGTNATGLASRPATVRFTVVGSGSDVGAGSPGSNPTPVPAPPPGSGGQQLGSSSTGKKWLAIPGAASEPGAPEPVINILGAVGVASNPVQVNALDSKLNAGSVITAHYKWDFGDPAGKYNTLSGWNAGHVYDTPGSYTVTLTVTNENGKTSTAATTVQVLPDNRRTIYVDAQNGSDDQNSGTSPDHPIKTAARVNELIRNGNVRVLFKRGQTFDFANWIDVNGYDTYLGAYGVGANPVIRITGTVGVYLTKNSVHSVIEGLTFDSPWAVTGTIADKTPADDGIVAAGTNALIRNCTFLNLDDAINTNPNPTGTLVQDNDAPLDTGIRGYFYWGEGTDAVILGNHVVNSTREHNIRLAGTSRVLVAQNDLTNMSRKKVDPQDYSKGTVEVQRGSYAYVADNMLHDGPLRAGPRGGSGEANDTYTDWVVFEGNHVFNYQVDIYPGMHHLMIRNNVLTNKDKAIIALNPTDNVGRDVSDIQVLNNTGINDGSTGQFFRTNGATPDGTITLGNNLYVAAKLDGGGNGTAPVYVAQKSLSAFAAIFNNVWPVPATMLKFGQGGINWVWPTYTGQAGFKSPSEWAAYPQVSGDVFRNVPIDATGHPATAGASVGRAIGAVLDDLYGVGRPIGGTITAGAVQV